MSLMLKNKRIRVYGPPGTGKTRWLQDEVTRLLDAGVPGEDIIVLSFSRAAFSEFAARLDGKLPDENMGTVHSMAYRLIGRPPIAVSPQFIENWNTTVPTLWHLTPRVRSSKKVDFDVLDPMSETEGGSRGDSIYNQINFLRNTRSPIRYWPQEALEFWREWSDFMRRERVVDFPGMLEDAIAYSSYPEARFILVDEAQDLNALQLDLIERWSVGSHLALIGDDDQAIYEFMGASGRSFLDFPVDYEHVLEQSYRIPRRAHAVAGLIAHRITNRAKKVYRPREEEGAVRYVGYSADSVTHLADDVLSKANEGMSVFILAPARYLLDPIKSELESRGEPYSNPYAPHRQDFNSFPLSRSNHTLGWERVRAFFYQRRLVKDVLMWAPYIKSEAFLGRKSEAIDTLNKLPKTLFADELGVLNLFYPDHRKHIVNRNPAWLAGMLMGSAPKNMHVAARVALRKPSLLMAGQARVWLGTIHSAKGGEADVVLVIPSLTNRWMSAPKDAIHRLFYVAVTRAKKELVLLDHSIKQAPHSYYWPLVGG